jgi:hypothetical protein
MLPHTTSHQSARGLAAASRALLVSIEPLLKWFSRRCLVKASMPSRCSQRSPTASCRKSLRCAPTGSLLARRSASAACCSNADSSRFTCGPNKLIFVAWRKIDLYPTSRVRFVKWFTIHLRPDCELSPALRNGALGRACFLVLLFLTLRNSPCLRRRRWSLIFRRGGCSQFRRRRALTGPELGALDPSGPSARSALPERSVCRPRSVASQGQPLGRTRHQKLGLSRTTKLLGRQYY